MLVQIAYLFANVCRKKMAMESFVTQFISAVGCKEKKGGVSIGNGGIRGSFSTYTAIHPHSLVLLPCGFSENGSLSTPNTSCILNCSVMQVSKILFFFRGGPKSFTNRFSVACNTMLIDKGGH